MILHHFFIQNIKIQSEEHRETFVTSNESASYVKTSWMTKTTKGTCTMLFTSRSLYTANFIASVSAHSLTVSYLPMLVTLQPRYTFRVLRRYVGVRRCARVRSASSVLRASSSNAFRELFLYRSRFQRFPVPISTEFLTKVCSLHCTDLIHRKGSLFIISSFIIGPFLYYIKAHLYHVN